MKQTRSQGHAAVASLYFMARVFAKEVAEAQSKTTRQVYLILLQFYEICHRIGCDLALFAREWVFVSRLEDVEQLDYLVSHCIHNALYHSPWHARIAPVSIRGKMEMGAFVHCKGWYDIYNAHHAAGIDMFVLPKSNHSPQRNTIEPPELVKPDSYGLER